MNASLKFYHHLGIRRLQPCPLPIPTRLQEHPKPGAGCDTYSVISILRQVIVGMVELKQLLLKLLKFSRFWFRFYEGIVTA